MSNINIYTDGACLGNPGPGGWAFIADIDGKIYEKKGHLENTTNNRAEFLAAIEAIKFASNYGGEFSIFTDSQLLYDTVTKWIFSWHKKNWKKSDGKPVQNLDLVQELWSLMHKYKIKWSKVPAHSGFELNEKCDKLAKEAANESEKNNIHNNNEIFYNEVNSLEKKQLISEDGKYELIFDDKSHTIEILQNNKIITKFILNKEVIHNFFR
jgi:ribonuclease HI